MASLCEYPSGLNGSAAQFERACGGDPPPHNHPAAGEEPRPLPCPAATAATAAAAAAATAVAVGDGEDAKEEPPPPAPSRRVTRSRAGAKQADDGKC